ncbi:MAG: hypothetical protein V3S43_06130 [Acidimicrobiia bacterium]
MTAESDREIAERVFLELPKQIDLEDALEWAVAEGREAELREIIKLLWVPHPHAASMLEGRLAARKDGGGDG